jgi:hypothetical protein
MKDRRDRGNYISTKEEKNVTGHLKEKCEKKISARGKRGVGGGPRVIAKRGSRSERRSRDIIASDEYGASRNVYLAALDQFHIVIHR